MVAGGEVRSNLKEDWKRFCLTYYWNAQFRSSKETSLEERNCHAVILLLLIKIKFIDWKPNKIFSRQTAGNELSRFRRGVSPIIQRNYIWCTFTFSCHRRWTAQLVRLENLDLPIFPFHNFYAFIFFTIFHPSSKSCDRKFLYLSLSSNSKPFSFREIARPSADHIRKDDFQCLQSSDNIPWS